MNQFKLKNVLTIIISILMIGCNDFMMIDGNSSSAGADDKLIEEIASSIDKVEVQYSSLPKNVLSTIESSFTTDILLNTMYASDLGYELTLANVRINDSENNKIYFNIDGRELGSGKSDRRYKRGQCFKMVFPISFTMPDNTEINILDKEDWLKIKNWYEYNPDIYKRPTMNYPVNISYKNSTAQTYSDGDDIELVYEDAMIVTINNDEEMIQIKKSCFSKIGCKNLEFIFPITYVMPDGTNIEVSRDDREGWKSVKDWYYNNDERKYSAKPDIVYPIEVILEDGSRVTINNDIEIKNLKDSSCQK